jgi:hypothetical protein
LLQVNDDRQIVRRSLIDPIRPSRRLFRVEEGLDTFADVGELEFVRRIGKPDGEVVVAFAGVGDSSTPTAKSKS